MKRRFVAVAMVWSIVLCCSLSVAAQPIEVKRVGFAAGASSATVKGSITGDKIVDYKLGAKAGQTMSVRLNTNSASNYFNLRLPSVCAPVSGNGTGCRGAPPCTAAEAMARIPHEFVLSPRVRR